MSFDANGNPVAAPVQPAATIPANPAQPANPAAPVNVYFQQPATPAPAPTPAQPAPAVPGTVIPAPTAPPATNLVPIPMEQLQAFTSMQARLAEIEAAQQRQRDEANRQVQDAMLLKGQAEDAVRLIREQSEQALQAERQRVADTERKASNYAIDVEVARALAPHVFSSNAARRHFEAEVRSSLTAVAEGNSFVVRTPTFQSAADIVNQKLADPEYAPFLAPKGNPGGGTQPNAAAPTPVNPAVQQQVIPEAAAPPYKNVGEYLIHHYKTERAKIESAPTSTYMPNRPIGLTPPV